MSILSIDPGKDGAAVLHRWTDTPRFCAFKGKSWSDVFFEILMWHHDCPIEDVYIEKVHAFRRDGKKSAFSFGKNVGIIFGGIEALRGAGQMCPTVREVEPMTWQMFFHVYMQGKAAAIARAEEILRDTYGWNRKLTDGEADAYLIGMYGKLTTTGEIYAPKKTNTNPPQPPSGILRTTRRKS